MLARPIIQLSDVRYISFRGYRKLKGTVAMPWRMLTYSLALFIVVVYMTTRRKSSMRFATGNRHLTLPWADAVELKSDFVGFFSSQSRGLRQASHKACLLHIGYWLLIM